MVYRIFVEKKREFAKEADTLRQDVVNILGIQHLTDVRVVNVYDVDRIDKQVFENAKRTVFSEPQTDRVTDTIDYDETDDVFAVAYLPGQFDQRAQSAAECIALISKGEKPVVKSSKMYILSGALKRDEVAAIRDYVVNPVESKVIPLEKPESLDTEYDLPQQVAVIEGFTEQSEIELIQFIDDYGLAMDIPDLKMCQAYFKEEKRQPTITEIKVIDTYWSDHCRHTTFNTILDDVKFEDKEIQNAFKEYIQMRKDLDRKKPVTLMDVGTIAAKYLSSQGKLDGLDASEEINACTVKIKANMDGKEEDWLLLFKNETHNHPTEIEPFGGAATCIGGAIRDPLSGRSYVYSAMRVTGAGNPLQPVSETIKGKLPQRKIVQTAADGYSSYGNQIGLATGQVDELYHPGYVAKRMEVGAVVAAAPAENVIRERPVDGDVVILLGGKTGRDGCGGATGSSKSHTEESLETCGAEVQKGNAPEERKIQRLFRNPEASKMIIRCNDFGAGGVSVAIGELADGLKVNLDMVPKKYEGLDGTELAISESQERMAVVVHPDNENRFKELAFSENLEATTVAKVTENPYLVLSWKGRDIVNISREFLDTNGAEKHANVYIKEHGDFQKQIDTEKKFPELMKEMVSDLNVCSKRGLAERFDSTIGAGTVLMPFGGKYQRTPSQAMVNLISSEMKDSNTCSLMAWGFNPYISEKSPYHAGYLAVVESVSKLVAAGASFDEVYLSFQEYFEKLGNSPIKWGKPLAAVLGAFKAQKDLEIAAIGGKDSMSGTFENISVPPTLISFAVTTEDAEKIVSPEFKKPGHGVYLIRPKKSKEGIPERDTLIKVLHTVHKLTSEGHAVSAYTPGYGGIAEAVFKMIIGNRIGFRFATRIKPEDIFGYEYGSFIVEMNDDCNIEDYVAKELIVPLGITVTNEAVICGKVKVSLDELETPYEEKLESIYRCNIKTADIDTEAFTYRSDKRLQPAETVEIPKVVIPVFPGTNCEYDSARAFRDAGADPTIYIINNQSPESINRSVNEFAQLVRESNIIFIPGGFSAGDEPDGSGKFITAFFRNREVKEAVNDLLENRDGLMAGICNGFQAMIKLGLVPFGKIMDVDESFPTLTYNEIGRHQSKIVRTRVASDLSPWLSETEPGQIYQVAISHGEGRFIASTELIDKLATNGQIATQYVDDHGNITSDIQYNPNGSFAAIEGITSPDGRVFGKMGHVERVGKHLYKNVPGNYDMGMFRGAVNYFRKK